MEITLIFTLDKIQKLSFPRFVDETGELCIYENNSNIPMDVARTFSICAVKGAKRGQHAHYLCSQILICLYGSCEVMCDDGANRTKVILDSPDCGLLVPPSIWSEQIYINRNTVIIVLCDRPYEKNDYIRDYDAFLAYRTEHDNE